MDYCFELPLRKVSEDMIINNPKNVSECELNTSYIIKNIESDDLSLKQFLFSLGCYEGERITLISIVSGIYVINIKDARYSIDLDLAKAIKI